jgi:hypothetical protein
VNGTLSMIGPIRRSSDRSYRAVLTRECAACRQRRATRCPGSLRQAFYRLARMHGPGGRSRSHAAGERLVRIAPPGRPS